MKRIIYILAIAVALASCQKELYMEPAISFFSDSPEIKDETAIFRMAFANFPDSTERVFPVTIGGTAEPGTDFVMSGDKFVYGGENPIDSIVVTTLKLGTSRVLSLSIEVPEGYTAGKYLKSEYILHSKLATFSFVSSYQMMSDSLDIAFKVLDRFGNPKSLNSEAGISLSINHEKSTAEEGVDFSFADSSRYVIKKGENQGSLMIRSLNPHPDEGKDKIVLDLTFSDKYEGGEVTEMEISLIDTLWKHLDGTWVADSLITDSLYMDRYWEGSFTGMDMFPKYNQNDKISISLDEASFTPSLRSEFKNYFIGESSLRKGNIITIDCGEGSPTELQTFWLDKTNRYFSAEEKSEDTESLIGLRFFPDNTDSLDLYLIDHTSRSFMPELDSLGKYAPEKPAAASPGLFLNLIFNRQ